MGYSLAGVIDALGEGVDCWDVGDRVVALAPHAEYVVCPAVLSSPEDQPRVWPMLPGVEFDAAPYWPLVSGAVAWVDIEQIAPNHTVVILGQGLVGSLMLQVARHNGMGRLIAVDAVASRCKLSVALGADAVVNAVEQDPVRAVRKLTKGAGADVVVYAVGGPAGIAVFDQGLDMLAVGGLLHLIGLYEDAPLPLSSGKIQRRKILGGYYGQGIGPGTAHRAMQLLQAGIPANIMIDCSHGNTNKDYTLQPKVAQYCIDQVMKGNESIIGLMLESNIHEGNQKITNDLKYGVSLTDACINWETTETLLLKLAKKLRTK